MTKKKFIIFVLLLSLGVLGVAGQDFSSSPAKAGTSQYNVGSDSAAGQTDSADQSGLGNSYNIAQPECTTKDGILNGIWAAASMGGFNLFNSDVSLWLVDGHYPIKCSIAGKETVFTKVFTLPELTRLGSFTKQLEMPMQPTIFQKILMILQPNRLKCGNGICEFGETLLNCPKDCQRGVSNSIVQQYGQRGSGGRICNNECEPGSKGCISSNVWRCTDSNFDGCTELIHTVCNGGCADGECINGDVCTDECQIGAGLCLQNTPFICGDPDMDSCTEWAEHLPCISPNVCKNGECLQPAPACSQDTDCLTGYACVNGECMLTCGDGVCNLPENYQTCPSDCLPQCIGDSDCLPGKACVDGMCKLVEPAYTVSSKPSKAVVGYPVEITLTRTYQPAEAGQGWEIMSIESLTTGYDVISWAVSGNSVSVNVVLYTQHESPILQITHSNKETTDVAIEGISMVIANSESFYVKQNENEEVTVTAPKASAAPLALIHANAASLSWWGITDLTGSVKLVLTDATLVPGEKLNVIITAIPVQTVFSKETLSRLADAASGYAAYGDIKLLTKALFSLQGELAVYFTKQGEMQEADENAYKTIQRLAAETTEHPPTQKEAENAANTLLAMGSGGEFIS